MLLSSRRHISDYASAAADVRLQIATTRANGRPISPVTEIERQGIQTIEELVNLGERFRHDPSGNLDFTGSTPEEIDLVSELEKLLPGSLPEVRGAGGEPDARKWSEYAARVFAQLKAEAAWDDFSPDLQQFVNEELEPFLIRLLNVIPEDKEE